MRDEAIHIIESKRSLFQVNFSEIWRYRDLLLLFVRRDFVTQFKQTILGPLWFFIQPVFASLIQAFVFGSIGKLSPSGVHPFLFFLAGNVIWNYFQQCVVSTSDTFLKNKNIFDKVYFPRLIVPLSVVTSNLLQLGIQLLLFITAFLIFKWQGQQVHLNSTALLLPVLIVIMAGLGLGIGLLITSLTTKYRDLKFLINFGMQLLMYITPGIIMTYADLIQKINENMSGLTATLASAFIKYNPLGPVIETFKHGFLNAGTYSPFMLLYSFIFMLVVLALGVLVFNKTEQNFIDTV